MEYVIVGLLVILIGLVVVLLIKKGSFSSGNELKEINAEQEKRILDDIGRLKSDVILTQNSTNQDLNNFKEGLNKSIEERFNMMNKTLTDGLLKITSDMNSQVKENLEKTSSTYADIQKKIGEIEQAQKGLEKIESSVESFKEIMVNKKTRGNYGEFQLNTILKDVFGDQENKIYFIQKDLSNGKTVDAMLSLPDPVGNLGIDSKFPFENYRKMYDMSLSEFERDNNRKLFQQDIKKHIDDIANKYIIKGETAEQAVMFIPSEAVFSEIQGNFTDSVEYARYKNVWIVSPTTLMAFLETLAMVLKERERSKGIKKILDNLNALSEDFRRYEERWNHLEAHLKTVSNDVTDIRTTTDKISTKFKQINKQSLPDKYKEEEEE